MTTRVSTDKHQELLSEKGGGGFPYLVMMDGSGEVIGVHQGERSVDGFKETGEGAREFMALRAKAQGGDEAAKAEYLLLRMERGLLKLAEAKTEVEGVKLSPEQQKKFDGLLLDLEIMETFSGARTSADPQTAMKEMGQAWLARAKAGETPVGEQPYLIYYVMILQYCEGAKDLEGYKVGMAGMEKRFGDSEEPRYQQMMEGLRENLKNLEEGSGDG